ncbi:MAG: ABC transporter ATP-binding protein [Candidatus Atribacteria bacterium]|jgi:branched-chain amino acid transport system ATP-binding protein|nr:ABC transporter ATP-binding protein [Candidatus Atribacteria bacterium]
MNIILRLNKVTKRFGGLVAVNAVEEEIYRGEIVGLIGSNGAGKTTLFNCIAGYYTPEEGVIEFEGSNITGMPSNQICHRGIARTFQLENIFKELTGLENVLVGTFCRVNSRKEALKKAYEKMEFCDLVYLSNISASSLNICDRKRLEFARALATDPKVLLIDELVAGLLPSEVQDIVALVKKVRKELGITVLWVEHVMEAIMNVSDRLIVLDHGIKIAGGTVKEITTNKAVIEAYLGVTYDA